MIVVGIPALVLGVLSVLQDVLLALEIRVVVADEGAALHAHRVDPAHEAAVLEVIAVAADLQLPPGEAFPLEQHDLWLWRSAAVTEGPEQPPQTFALGLTREAPASASHCFYSPFLSTETFSAVLLPIKQQHGCGGEKMRTPGFIRPTGSQALSQGRPEQ